MSLFGQCKSFSSLNHLLGLRPWTTLLGEWSPEPYTGAGFKEKDLRKRYLLSLEWKREGVMDNESGDDETDELRELG